MSFYIADKFQCKDTWELIDSNNCTRPLAELVKWSDGWTLELFIESLPAPAEDLLVNFLSRQVNRGLLDSLYFDLPTMDLFVEHFGLHISGEPEPRQVSELPVWLL